MVTAKKVAEKKTKAPAVPKEPTFAMPQEVKDWIERASSIMKHHQGEILRLKQEIVELKSYKKWAEHRILRSDHEE